MLSPLTILPAQAIRRLEHAFRNAPPVVTATIHTARTTVEEIVSVAGDGIPTLHPPSRRNHQTDAIGVAKSTLGGDDGTLARDESVRLAAGVGHADARVLRLPQDAGVLHLVVTDAILGNVTRQDIWVRVTGKELQAACRLTTDLRPTSVKRK